MATQIDMKWMVINSPQLANLIGSRDRVLVSKPKVLEKLGAYLEKKNLLTDDGLQFTPDDTLEVLFEDMANQKVCKMWGHLVGSWKLVSPSHATR